MESQRGPQNQEVFRTLQLKLGPIEDDKPVKVTLELPATLHRDLAAYAEILGRGTGQAPTGPVRLIVPMLARFIATDRGFVKARRMRVTRVTEK